MSRLPENYQRLINSSDGNCTDYSHSIKSYQDLIQKKLQGDKLAPVYESMNETIQVLCRSERMDEDSLQYTAELLARLNRHLDSETSFDEKKKNFAQLELLLDNNVAYIFDPDVMNVILYSLGVAALASIAILAVAGATIFLMTNPVMSFMIVLPIFVLITMGVEAIGGALGFSGYMLYLAPGLFLATVGTYLATFATLSGIYLGTQHCVNEIAFSANNYSLKSDTSTLMNMGMFTHSPEVQDDYETPLPHTPDMM